MAVTIENRTNRPVLLRLNSGETLHLAPRTTSGVLVDVEVEPNAKVTKLVGQQMIAVHKLTEKAASPTLAKEKADKEGGEPALPAKRKKADAPKTAQEGPLPEGGQ